MKTGDCIDDYKLLRFCGKGAFGEVFLASNVLTGKNVALKVVKKEGHTSDRELQAVRDYIKCGSNEFLLTIHHAAQKDDFFYYTMELADNLEDTDECYTADTLQKRLEQKGALSVEETIDLAKQLLDGLKILHDHNLIHRDIKPANILWINGRVKLGDIGLLAHDNSMTCQAGTPGFMPPSNWGIRSNSPQTDLYALAQVLYRCLTGQRADGFDDLELTEDLQKNGAVLLKTIDLVCRKNSPIKTADQFLESITRPSRTAHAKTVKKRKKTSKAKPKPQCHIPPISADEEISAAGNYFEGSSGYISPETYDDGTSTFGKVVKWGLLALRTMVPGSSRVKGLATGAALVTGHLIESFEKDQRIEELRYQKESLERQKKILLDRLKKEKDDDDDESL